MSTRIRYIATYDYPGLLFPESTSRPIEDGTIRAVYAGAQREAGSRSDGWYAATVTAITEKRFVDPEQRDDETWVEQRRDRVLRFVIGEVRHVDTIPDDDQHRILRANIVANTSDHLAVLTRCGNWQLASDYDSVVSPEAVYA